MNLAQVLIDVLIPIFLIFGIGVLLGKKKNPDPRPIAHLSIYILLPSLVFISFLNGNIMNKLAVIGVYILSFTGIMYILSVIICKIFHFDRPLESAFLLSVLFSNHGNYGVPLCTFAFGEEGMTNALAYMMYGSVIMYTVAVYIASRGCCSSTHYYLHPDDSTIFHRKTTFLAGVRCHPCSHGSSGNSTITYYIAEILWVPGSLNTRPSGALSPGRHCAHRSNGSGWCPEKCTHPGEFHAYGHQFRIDCYRI